MLVSKVNSFNPNSRPTFKATPSIIKTGYAVLSGDAVHKAGSLKSVCKEILLRINNDKSLIAAAVAALGGIKLTETAITFYGEDKDSIRLSMPKGPQGELFKMQILKEDKPVNTVMIDNFNKLVDSYSLNRTHYIKAKDTDIDMVNATVVGVFDSVDEELFKVRMFARRSTEAQQKPTEKVTPVSMPKVKDIAEQRRKKALEKDKDKRFIPTVEQMKSYSVTELIRQDAAKQAKEAKKAKSKQMQEEKTVKAGKKRLIPLSSLTEEQKAKLKPAISNDLIPAITLEEGVKVDSIVLDAKKEMITIKEKRGRRKANSKVAASKSSTQKEAKPVKVESVRRGRPAKASSLAEKTPAGVISVDMKSKLEEINRLSASIFEELSKFSHATAVKIRAAYYGVKTNKNRINFGDLIISNPQRKEHKGHQITAITDRKINLSLNVSDLANVIVQDFDWAATAIPKLKFLSQAELDSRFKDKKYDNLIDRATEYLQGFKVFLEQRGWTKKVAKTTMVDSSVSMNDSVLTKLNAVNEKYNALMGALKSMPAYKAGKLKKDFGQLALVKSSSRLEFINPMSDGTNLLYNISKSRYGEFIFIVKHDGTKNLEEVFVISKDGKLVKNCHKTMGLNIILPTNPSQQLRFYSQEEFASNGKEEKLQELLAVLDEKITEFQSFIENSKTRPRRQRAATKPVVSEKTEKSIPASVIKEFFENTVQEFQTKADKVAELTGFKSILDSVAKNLKTRFSEFLKNQG